MRVVVIGAGVGGLAVAGRLAGAGHRVTVFEQAPRVGGKLATRERRTAEGVFRFDTGPTLITLPQVVREFADVTLIRVDPVVRHVFADGSTVDSSADPATFASRIADTFGAPAADEWRRLWRRAARVWRAAERDVLNSTVDSTLGLARMAWRLRDLAAIAPGRSLHDVGRRHLSDPHLRDLLDRYATYAGADPRRAPAALVAIPYAELTYGGWYLPGGLSTLAGALLDRATAAGAIVHCGARVTRIELTGGRAGGVRLADGTRVPAEMVVANADALSVYRDLLPRPGPASRLGDRSLSGFLLLLGLRGGSAPAQHTVYFPADYRAEFDALARGRPPADPALYVTVPDDPAVRPDGYQAATVLVNVPPQGTVDWRAPGLAEAYARRLLDRLAARVPGLRDRLVFHEIRTPADLAEATASPGGSIYGTAAHGLLRPANRGPVPGLYLVGGSTHPGGGIPLVLRSAHIVATDIGPA